MMETYDQKVINEIMSNWAIFKFVGDKVKLVSSVRPDISFLEWAKADFYPWSVYHSELNINGIKLELWHPDCIFNDKDSCGPMLTTMQMLEGLVEPGHPSWSPVYVSPEDNIACTITTEDEVLIKQLGASEWVKVGEASCCEIDHLKNFLPNHRWTKLPLHLASAYCPPDLLCVKYFKEYWTQSM